MNEDQFGFRPQISALNAAMAIKASVQESLDAGELIAFNSLDILGAFDAAWWPGILRELRESKCPTNLYRLTMSYFIQRTAVLSTNSLRTEKVKKRTPAGVLLWTMILEHTFQFAAATQIYGIKQSRGIRR